MQGTVIAFVPLQDDMQVACFARPDGTDALILVDPGWWGGWPVRHPRNVVVALAWRLLHRERGTYTGHVAPGTRPTVLTRRCLQWVQLEHDPSWRAALGPPRPQQPARPRRLS